MYHVEFIQRNPDPVDEAEFDQIKKILLEAYERHPEEDSFLLISKLTEPLPTVKKKLQFVAGKASLELALRKTADKLFLRFKQPEAAQLAARILDFLKKKGTPQSAPEIADGIGVSRQRAYRRLKTLKKEGRIQASGSNRHMRYSVTPP